MVRHWFRWRRRGWSTLAKSLPKLEVKTLIDTLTDMLKEVGVATLGFTLKETKAKVLINTVANSKREVDVVTLSNQGAGIV